MAETICRWGEVSILRAGVPGPTRSPRPAHGHLEWDSRAPTHLWAAAGGTPGQAARTEEAAPPPSHISTSPTCWSLKKHHQLLLVSQPHSKMSKLGHRPRRADVCHTKGSVFLLLVGAPTHQPGLFGHTRSAHMWGTDRQQWFSLASLTWPVPALAFCGWTCIFLPPTEAPPIPKVRPDAPVTSQDRPTPRTPRCGAALS